MNEFDRLLLEHPEPWVPLEVAQALVIRANVFPVIWHLFEDQRSLDPVSIDRLQKWMVRMGFAGVRMQGRPGRRSDPGSHGPLQDIPVQYFRRPRGFLGKFGIWITSASAEAEEHDQIERDLEAGIVETDWNEVIVYKEELVKFLKENNTFTPVPADQTEPEKLRTYRIPEMPTPNKRDQYEAWLDLNKVWTEESGIPFLPPNQIARLLNESRVLRAPDSKTKEHERKNPRHKPDTIRRLLGLKR